MSRCGSLALPALLLLASCTGAIWVGLQPRPGQAVAAFFPPWWSAAQAFGAAATAGADILRPGAWPGIVVVTSAEPGLAVRLHRAGAWLLLDARAAGGCGTPEPWSHA